MDFLKRWINVRAHFFLVQFLIGLQVRIVENSSRKEASVHAVRAANSGRIPHALSVGELEQLQTVAQCCQRGMALPVMGLVGAYIFVCRLKTLNSFMT